MIKKIKIEKGFTTFSFHERGFTFIEVILYVAIITIVMSALIPFAWSVIEGGVQSSSQQEVFSQARFVSERIKYEIRNANGINSVSPTNISLAVSPPANDPTIIDLAAGNIRIKLGAASAVNLNSTDTKITTLTFTNYSSADNKTKHIQFSFTIDDNYPSGRAEYDVPSYTLEGSAELRSN
ncbi:prepilin-type N-terminal cleavage/methylation domain-containing protein [Candidatus Daviesbacteria bacterium]|nr:prepilin-type N-terminal cleavage/methylation domain-containing protein [Candidatus Daviesbacteria bacterium]